MTNLNTIVNRHIARLMTELEEAGCPRIFREAVKGKLQWMRQDLGELREIVDVSETDDVWRDGRRGRG